MDHAFGIISNNSLPNPRLQRFPPVFSSRSFRVAGFTFRSMRYFELIFICDVRYNQNAFSPPHGQPVVLAPFIEKTVLFPLNCFHIFIEN